MPTELTATRTPCTALELGSAFVGAWRELFGTAPARDTILLLLSQSAHETGRWRSMWCHNIGNVKSRSADGCDFMFLRCREVIEGKTVWFDPPHPATRFRAFRTLLEGAVDHLAFLRGKQRYAAAWHALELGEPLTFAAALKAGGYYTDPVAVYARALGWYFDEFNRTLPLELEPPEIDDETRARTMASVALSLRELGGEFVVRDTEPAPPDPDKGNA